MVLRPKHMPFFLIPHTYTTCTVTMGSVSLKKPMPIGWSSHSQEVPL